MVSVVSVHSIASPTDVCYTNDVRFILISRGISYKLNFNLL